MLGALKGLTRSSGSGKCLRDSASSITLSSIESLSPEFVDPLFCSGSGWWLDDQSLQARNWFRIRWYSSGGSWGSCIGWLESLDWLDISRIWGNCLDDRLFVSERQWTWIVWQGKLADRAIRWTWKEEVRSLFRTSIYKHDSEWPYNSDWQRSDMWGIKWKGYMTIEKLNTHVVSHHVKRCSALSSIHRPSCDVVLLDWKAQSAQWKTDSCP